MNTAERLKAMQDRLAGGVSVVTAPQLFPTPPELAAEMVERAELWPDYEDGPNDCKILEPSAGTGNIVDAILAEGLTWQNVTICELNASLCQQLSAKYRRVYPGDFLERTGWELGAPFDRVLMNPPFERGADIKHIKHALTMLKPGGRLVAICAAGPRQHEQLAPLGDWEPLPAGTFKNQGTNVNTALIIIDKD